jgi:protoporphyrinogen oxidase
MLSSGEFDRRSGQFPIVVIGAGPAGLGLAWRLARRREFRVTVLERNEHPGGNAGSFAWGGQSVDFGSHRLHPASDPEILCDVKQLLGEDLLDRPRHGRIRLRGRWLHFPLKPQEAFTRLPPDFVAGIALDTVRKAVMRNGQDTFASVLERGLGQTICREFYFPYARKIWGLDPHELDGEQARRRVAAGSLSKLVRKVLGAVPGFKQPGKGHFYYPRQGFGQISQAYCEAAVKAGAEVLFQTNLQRIDVGQGPLASVEVQQAGAPHCLTAAHVFSTIPLPALARTLDPPPPAEIMDAAARLRYRSMILIYLQLQTERFTEFDAHYFPEAALRITRLSEPKHYALAETPTTVLCAELPCDYGDQLWRQSDQQLAELVEQDLAAAGLPVRAPVLDVTTRRLPQAYPIYTRGFRRDFDQLDAWIIRHRGITSLGRQGLFAHDNTHHTLAMAYAAESCLAADGTFDHQRWAEFRRQFESHVVED